jgi:hypothetical protein
MFAPFALVRIFALGAEYFVAIYAEEHTISAFRLIANVAVAELTRPFKFVALSTPSHANLGHFAVCALIFRASWHTRTYLSKSRTMIFAKATTQAKDL